MHAPIERPQPPISLLVDGPEGGQQANMATARRLCLHLRPQDVQRIEDGADQRADYRTGDKVPQEFTEEVV